MSHSHADYKKPAQIAGVAAVAALVGALVAMLFTPRRGNEIRTEIRQRTAKAKSQAMDRFHQTHDLAADDLSDQTRADVHDTIVAAKSRLRKTATRAKADTKTTTRNVKGAVRKTAKQIKDEADEIRRNGEP